MTDKRLSSTEVNPRWEGPIVDGLFVWTDATQGALNDPVYLKADGPPIQVGKAAVNAATIGFLLDKPVQNAKCTVFTKYQAILAMTCGGNIVRGDYVKLDASSKIVTFSAIGNAALNSTFSDVEVEAALDALRDALQNRGAVIGQALQSGANNDIIYVGIGG